MALLPESVTAAAGVSLTRQGHVATIRFSRPPHNFIDVMMLQQIADHLAELDADMECRAVVLASDGKAFCAGVDFGAGIGPGIDTRAFYAQAVRLFDTGKPIVVAVHGPAVGAGAGLAMAGDFRVASKRARFVVNFNRLGFHPGFGLTATLPRVLGPQAAAALFYLGRRIDGAEAREIGAVDRLVEEGEELAAAQAMAAEIALSAPLAVQSTRRTLREGLAAAVRAAIEREIGEQTKHFATRDFTEGIRAMSERRLPEFHGR